MTLTPEDGTGLATANSFVSAADADAYMEQHLQSSTWDAAPDATKEKALAHATRYLDSAARWKGCRKTADQALGWPRTEVEFDGFDVASDTVPQPVKHAAVELARLLLDDDLQAEQQQDQIESIGLGGGALDIKFKDKARKRRMPIAINELLQGLGYVPTAGTINQRPLVR